MTRRLLTAALALSVAGGVYMAGAPAQASNMGFKLEREFDFRVNAQGRPLTNIYMVSLPYFNGMGDVANTGFAGPNKCVGDGGAQPGPTSGDGWINVDDAICDWWQARNAVLPPTPETAGSISVSYYNRTDCLPVSRLVSVRFNIPTFPATGLFPPDDGDGDPSNNTDLWTDRGYQVNLAAPTGFTPRNRVIIVGSHDPAFPGQPIAASALCGARAAQIDLLAVPYHTMHRTAIELQCGLEFTNWTDDGLSEAGVPVPGTDGDGAPDHLDECDTSIFDGANSLAVNRWYNDPPPGVSGAVSCLVAVRFGSIDFAGCRGASNFPLVPGEAYSVNIPRAQRPTVYLSPHF